MQWLAELAAAARRGLRTQLASVALGMFVARRLDAGRLALADGAAILVFLALLVWSLHGIVRPRWYQAQFKMWKGNLPTTSGIDLGVDALMTGLGAMYWSLSRSGGPSATMLLGFGIGGVAVPVLLGLTRVGFWRRRPTA